MIGKRRRKAKYKKKFEKVSEVYDTVKVANKGHLKEIEKLEGEKFQY